MHTARRRVPVSMTSGRPARLLDGAHVPHRDLRHQGLPAPTARLVDRALRAALAEHAPDVTGLAGGADQVFARAVTDLGGTLEAVIPAAEYREKLPEDSHPEYDALFARAAAVHRCRSPSPRPSPTWPPESS